MQSVLVRLETKEEVEKFFENYKIENIEERIEILQKVMGNPKVFYTNMTGIPMTKEQEYELNLIAFLTRKWEYAKMLRWHLEV